VGKTTTAVNLAAGLSLAERKTLLIDLDPQGNATTGLGVNKGDLPRTIYHVILEGVAILEAARPTEIPCLAMIPSDIDLVGAEIELVGMDDRQQRLRDALKPVQPEFEYVIIDCPPSLGLLTVNGLAAAGEVLVPIQCEYYALEGLGQLLRNVDLVKRNLNPTLDLSTIICVMYDARTKLADQVVSEVRDHFGEKVLRTVIPRTVRLSEAPSFGQPINTFDSRSRGATAYRDAAREVHRGAA
jgi:chromosome partitioning protein